MDYRAWIDHPPEDIAALAAPVVPSSPAPAGPAHQLPMGDKLDALAQEFAGRPALALWHAFLVVHLRRGHDLPATWTRYRSLWEKACTPLLECLDARWLVSAADSFADHAEDPLERAAAMGAVLFANTLKLYETERRIRGTDLRPLTGPPEALPLFSGMTMFVIARGDLLANLAGRLGRLDDAPHPLARILQALATRLAAEDTALNRMSRFQGAPFVQRAQGRPAPLRIALFNDTSQGGHFGCEAVMDTIDRLFTGADCDIIHRHPLAHDWQGDADAARALQRADRIVVNGEGTIHHSRPRARKLAALGPMARSLGKPAYLINATLQENDAPLAADLRAFTHVWVRESASLAWAAQNGIAASLCPDLSLCQMLPRARRADITALVTDSVVKPDAQALGLFARQLASPMVTLFHTPEGQVLGLRQPRLPRAPGDALAPFEPLFPAPTFRHFARALSRRKRLVTGRFHAVCLALVQRVPFHAIPSNTWKIEAMIADIGLDPARLIAPGAALPPELPFSAPEEAAIARYILQARAAAGHMAERIVQGT